MSALHLYGNFTFIMVWCAADNCGSVALNMNERKWTILAFATSGKNAMLGFQGMRFPAAVI